MKRFFWLILVPLFAWFGRDGDRIVHAQPTVSQSYGLTLERDDFPRTTAGQTVFQTTVAARSSYAEVFRNGLLQRPCPSDGCDYTQSGNVTVTYPAGVIQPGDLVTIKFQR
jgi:hypothetical protein